MKKHDYDKILYRLNTIWQRLREGEVLSVKDLALEFNVSTKTIQRDFNERLVQKLPIEKSGHKWRVKDGYNLDKNLSFEENLVLDVLQELAVSMGTNFSSKTKNLFSKLQNSHDNPIYSKMDIEDILDKYDVIKQLQDSIINFYQIEFYYKGQYRVVEPYKITTFEGYWYLYGNDVIKNRLKTFYIKDIKKLKSTKIFFEKNYEALKKLQEAINVWFEPNSKPFEVRLLIKNDIAKYFIRRPLSSNQIIINKFEDGSIEVTLQVTSTKEIIYELKKWQPNIIVIEPKSLAKNMLEINKKYYDEQTKFLT